MKMNMLNDFEVGIQQFCCLYMLMSDIGCLAYVIHILEFYSSFT